MILRVGRGLRLPSFRTSIKLVITLVSPMAHMLTLLVDT